MPDAPRPPVLRRVVVTGGAGRIARAVSPGLREAWDLALTDREASEGVAALDVSDVDACRTAFAGADAVVHLAANPSPHATFDELLSPNVVGAYAVAQAAVDARVRRLVLASSLHAMSGVPERAQRRAGDQPRPGNLYGATKAWAEALGAWAAATSDLEVVALRIGYFGEQRPGPEASLHERTSWLSPRDATALLRAAVEAELPVGAAGFLVANGVSDNQHNVADLRATRDALGYAPLDDAWSS